MPKEKKSFEEYCKSNDWCVAIRDFDREWAPYGARLRQNLVALGEAVEQDNQIYFKRGRR